MTDKFLLEDAAKAIGLGISHFWMDKTTGKLQWAVPEDVTIDRWNPLNDDGDALRLAVKIGATVHAYGRASYCGASVVGFEKICVYRDEEPDPCAATRLAIVRAAAEIGKQCHNDS